MRPSRGMGAIAPRKMPKVRKVVRKDGPQPTKLFKKGGKVRKFSEGREVDREAGPEDRAGFKKRDYDKAPSEREARFSFMGGGSKDKSAASAGGRLSYEIPVGKYTTVSPYLEGFVEKPQDRKWSGRVTGGGLMLQHRFKKGGKALKSKVRGGGYNS